MSGPATTSKPSRPGRRLAMRIAKWLIAVIVTIGLFFAVRASVLQWQTESEKVRSEVARLRQQVEQSESPAQRDQLQQRIERLRSTMPTLPNLNWGAIALAGLFYAAGLVPNSFLLRRALLSFGQRPRVSTSIAAHLLGHVGKYVPGKAMVVVLRAGALRRDGVSVLPATISVFLETFLMMAVGAAVAGFIVLWLPVPAWITVTAVSVAIVASLPTIPPVLRIVAARVSKSKDIRDDVRIGYGLFAAGWGWSVLTWALIGASFASLILAIPTSSPIPPLPQLYAIATAAVSLAVVVGFASLLPGGAGIRELVLTTILAVSFGHIHGLLAAIAARILFIVVEAILAGASWWWLQRSASS